MESSPQEGFSSLFPSLQYVQSPWRGEASLEMTEKAC